LPDPAAASGHGGESPVAAAAALRLRDRTVVGMGRVLLFGGMCIAFRRDGLFFCALGLVEP